MLLLMLVNLESQHSGRFALLIASGTFAVALAMLVVTKSEPKTLTIGVFASVSAALLLLYVGKDIHANVNVPGDLSSQAALRETGAILRPLVDKNGLVLFHSKEVDLAYLCIMYWSGADTLDACLEPDASASAASLRYRDNIYLITKIPLQAAPLAKTPVGNLYHLKEISSEVWSPAVTEACEKK